MQIVVLMGTQNSHSGLSTYRVNSVGTHMGTTGLNSTKRIQKGNAAVAMLSNIIAFENGSCTGKKTKETN